MAFLQNFGVSGLKRGLGGLCLAGFSTMTMFSFAPTAPAIALPKLAQAPTNNQTQLLEKAQQFIAFLNQKNYEAARNATAKSLQPFLSAEEIATIWETDIQGSFGKFQQTLPGQVIHVINGNLVMLPVKFANNTEDFLFTFNERNELVGVDWASSKTIPDIVNAFVGSLANQDYLKARRFISPLLKLEFPPERLQKGWEGLQKVQGRYRGIGNISIKNSNLPNVDDVAIVTLNFERGSQKVFLFFDDNNRIINIDFLQDN